MSSLRRYASVASALCLGLGHALQSAAQPEVPAAGTSTSAAQEASLAEVIVTAQKREQNIQAGPIAITALSGDELASRGITTTEDLAAATPGVTVTEYGQVAAFTTINIRGVTQLDLSDEEESPNALYIDGAYISQAGAAGLGLFDIAQT